jgi:hypothetical protein
MGFIFLIILIVEIIVCIGLFIAKRKSKPGSISKKVFSILFYLSLLLPLKFILVVIYFLTNMGHC